VSNVLSVQGDATCLAFPDNAFDIVLCTEVLEHIPPPSLFMASQEIIRVTKYYAVIGVPYKQDIRLNRTICLSCKKRNPAWGHVNSFDENKLRHLFEPLRLEKMSFIGSKREKTNMVSVYLWDLAGNPWGTYVQQEPCVNCGNKLIAPSGRSVIQRLCSKLADYIHMAQSCFIPITPVWVHMVFKKASHL